VHFRRCGIRIAARSSDILEAGILASLTKPVGSSQLYDALVAAMDTSSASAEVLAPPVEQSREITVAGPRVLIAEDNAVNQRVAVHMLAKLGYQADVVANGQEALDALVRIPYPLARLDMRNRV